MSQNITKYLLSFLCLALISLIFTPQANAIFCTPNNAATWTISTSCVIYEDANGPTNQNIVLNSGVSMTIHNGKKLIWYPGKSITIPTGASIVVATGGSIQQRKVCIKDSGLAAGQAASGIPYFKTGTDPRTGLPLPLGDDIVPADASGNCTSPYRLSDVMTTRDWVDVGGAGTALTGARASTYQSLENLGFGVSAINSGNKETGTPANPVKVTNENVKVCSGSTTCTVGDAADTGNMIAEGYLGVGKTPTTNLDINGSLTATSNIISGTTTKMTTLGHWIDNWPSSSAYGRYKANSAGPAIAMANNAGTLYGYFYGDSSGFGTLTSSGSWSSRMDNAGNLWLGDSQPNVSTLNISNNSASTNPGLAVGNGSVGYVRIGSSGWYDDGTYFSPIAGRYFYVQTNFPTTYIYSPNIYFGDSSVGPVVQLRNTNLTGNNFYINNAGNSSFTKVTSAGSNTAADHVYIGDNTGGAAWKGLITMQNNANNYNWNFGYMGDGSYRWVWGTGAAGPWYHQFLLFPDRMWSGGDISFLPGGVSSYGLYTREATTPNGPTYNYDSWLRFKWQTNKNTYHQLAVGAFVAAGAQRFDLAEITPVDPSENLILGEIVTTDPGHSVRLHRSQSPYQTDTVGIVSNGRTASMVIGGDTGPEVADSTPDRKPIALAGRVVTFVNTENGPIKTGDVITTSSTAGVGMKAKEAGVVVSKAMEDFDGKTVNSEGVTKILEKLKAELKKEDPKYPQYKQIENAISQLEKPLPKNTGRIITFVNVHSYDPDIKLVNLDDYELDGEKLTKDGSTINRLGAYAKLITGKLTTSLVETKKLVVDGVDLLSKIEKQETEIKELESEVSKLSQQ